MERCRPLHLGLGSPRQLEEPRKPHGGGRGPEYGTRRGGSLRGGDQDPSRTLHALRAIQHSPDSRRHLPPVPESRFGGPAIEAPGESPPPLTVDPSDRWGPSSNQRSAGSAGPAAGAAVLCEDG